MNRVLTSIAVLTAFVFLGLGAPIWRAGEPIQFEIPDGWPEPTYDFNKNPLVSEGVELGRYLFYDPILSRDSTISCSSCHSSYTAFTHVDHDLSHGIDDRIGTRNSPALFNLAWSRLFMWDGAVNHLDVQALAPITHPDEMGESILSVVKKLQRHPEYPKRFNSAFGDCNISGELLMKALSQFQLTLVSSNSRYDSVMGDPDIHFNEQEKRGHELFQANCNSCHSEPLFSNGKFADNGLSPDEDLKDIGRMKITQNEKDLYSFKIPSLRNIEYSFPYMHDGRFETLAEVLAYYGEGKVVKRASLHPDLKDLPALEMNERLDITCFLLTLTDRKFLFNPDYSYPKY